MKTMTHPLGTRPRRRSDSGLAVLGSIFLSLGTLPVLYAVLLLQG
ncbi:hypothetical protein [Sphingomonas sp.]|nr:hypothetical protein [Sphingomonas sp.]HEU4969060.1 hypothetical protein [Sphingomonas sp.]